ncbi:hypothetical protein [Spirosoma sordidisoli]|uniref:Uncharacterized protein n=1 Tax=Spirosoma sordidisoli TaxID=2502893 RepID=A0A4Q2USH3_9BACT|nr:hypothetical protein [Spirosoma sordidisoli]RYC69779.1 hypothetical protein EQG79_14385 [Spirosoma sordidisoli]
MTTLETEQAWLEQIEASRLVGICLLDAEGRLVQRLDDDPTLKEAIADWQAQRIRELNRSAFRSQTAAYELPGESYQPQTA